MKSSDAPEPVVQPWRTLHDEEIADCRIFSLRRVRRSSPTTDREGDFYYIAGSDWVNVVAITDDQRLVLIRQYRHAIDEITLEIPGGIVDPGEGAVDAARRELLEETGYDARNLEVIGRVRSNPAIIANWTYTVLATGLSEQGEADFDDHEEISVEFIPLDQIDQTLRSGAITHALVVDAFMWYRLYRDGRGAGL